MTTLKYHGTTADAAEVLGTRTPLHDVLIDMGGSCDRSGQHVTIYLPTGREMMLSSGERALWTLLTHLNGGSVPLWEVANRCDDDAWSGVLEALVALRPVAVPR